MAAISGTMLALGAAGAFAATQMMNKGGGVSQLLNSGMNAAQATTQPAMKDPAIEQAAADAKAAQNTNEALAAKNKARKSSSLLAAGDPATSLATATTTGKTTLGQ